MKIKILYQPPCGEISKNLTPGSIHDVVNPPTEHTKRNPNGDRGYWVNGTTEPVLVLHRELEVVNEFKHSVLTTEELQSKIDKADSVVECGTVDNKTRKGVYLKIKKGLSWAVLFKGTDLENNKEIIEVVQ